MRLEIYHPVRVYIEDTDAGGIVYYVNYLKFMERARTELLRSWGYGKAVLFDEQLMFVVHSVNARYHKPARLDDELSVLARVTDIGRAAFNVEQAVYRDGVALCSADIKIACVSQEGMRPMPIPADLRARIQQYLQHSTFKHNPFNKGLPVENDK